ncbi:unnamed protein product, partial [Rotaria sp. Silwood1]
MASKKQMFAIAGGVL